MGKNIAFVFSSNPAYNITVYDLYETDVHGGIRSNCASLKLAEGELDSLFLFPEFQGRGIGTAVLRHCQAVSPALRLFVFKENIRALSLYQKLGFEVTAEAGTTRYIMEWKNQDR